MLFLRMMGEIMLTPDDEAPPIMKLTPSQAKVHLYLALRGPQRMSEIARLLSIGLPSATPIADGLVSMKLARRREDPGDRRVVLIELTPAGQRLHEQMSQHHVRKLKRAFSHLKAKQQRQVLDNLREVVQLMRKQEPVPAATGSGRRRA